MSKPVSSGEGAKIIVQQDVFDRDKVDEIVLALLQLTLHDSNRAWKGFDWETLDRLYEKGWIENPRSKAKSVVLTEEGLANSVRLFQLYFEGSNETLGEP
jgi:Domain of unknown function (DUF6429)